MRYALLLLAVCLLVGKPGVAFAKVGYINLQRLVNESEMGKNAKADIIKLRRDKEQAVAAKQRRINQVRQELAQATDMDPAARQAKIEQIQKDYKEYQRMVADAREDITREDRQLVQIILKKADGVLKKIAKKKRYTIILKDPNAVGYLDPSVDITDLVLKELNKK
jgi:outer membrane protein